MRTLLKRRFSTRKSIRYVLMILPFLFLLITGDPIQNIPYFYEVFLLFLLYALFDLLRRIFIPDRQTKSDRSIRIKGQFDDLNRIMFFVAGISCIGLAVSQSSSATASIEVIDFSLIGLLCMTYGVTFRKSVVLQRINESIVAIQDSDFEIHSQDRDVTFSMFKMSLTTSSGEEKHVTNLILNREEAQRISDWLRTSLTESNLRYHWKHQNQVHAIKARIGVVRLS